MTPTFSIIITDENHVRYAAEVADLLAAAAEDPNTGLAKRSPDYLSAKIKAGNAVLALADGTHLAGFCYVETWEHGKYIANSGLIVASGYRGYGLAKRIKTRIFKLSRTKFPDAKLFGLTTSPAVMHINSELGYRPVAFAELTQDAAFWAGCQSCDFFDVLTRTQRVNCLCTGMLLDPQRGNG